jgi:thymidylate synthase
LTASTSKDTLISISKNDVDLLNKVMLSENFYRSMYDVNDDKIKLFEKKIVTLEDIIQRNERIISLQEKNVETLTEENRKLQLSTNDAWKETAIETHKRLIWRQRALLSIPISLAGGFLIATLIQ